MAVLPPSLRLIFVNMFMINEISKPFDSPEFVFFLHNFITFTFQHIVGRSQFSALCHFDLKEHLVSQTGGKPLRCTPSLRVMHYFWYFLFDLAGIGDCTDPFVPVQGVGVP